MSTGIQGMFTSLIAVLLLSGCNPSMDSIYQEVIDDSLRQYQLSKKGGDEIEICVMAGIVVASYLQANDEANYLKWKRIEKRDCEQAGISY